MLSRKERANALRVLAIDAIEQAKSGHPGAPLGMADMAEALWHGILRHNPANPRWHDRDRFVLSNGHASALLYALLHMTGYAVSMNDLRQFRQLDSKTPGHPEFGVTPGVDVTTGPLGQGLATAVGMALAEKLLAAEFNREGFPIVNHFTYVFAGDGCLMEGISQEAISLAGVLELSKLIVLYDSNGISIDGPVSGWFKDDTAARFAACGWDVTTVDGHDGDVIADAIKAARCSDRPSLIICNTTIGYGSPNQAGKASCHGSPLGADELAKTKDALGWHLPPFEMSREQYEAWDARKQGEKDESAWNGLFKDYAEKWPFLADSYSKRMDGSVPRALLEAMDATIGKWNVDRPSIATRAANKNVLDVIAPNFSSLFGFSADLSGSVGTKHGMSCPVNGDKAHGNYLSCGVREFAMGAMMNGMALHGGFLPYGGTFLVFSDYERSAIRLAALMRTRVVHVLTHDSIGVGEDGPTHQPVEQISSLRLMPGVDVWRPCDAVETAVAWRQAILRQGPTCMIMSRQSLPCQVHPSDTLPLIQRGGYVLKDADRTPDLILIATGSEVQLAVAASDELAKEGYRIRVVSMPCMDVFDAQDDSYRNAVLIPTVRSRIAIEAADTQLWWKYVGLDGAVIGMHGFGASAPAGALFQRFGITTRAIIERAKLMLIR